MIKKILLIIVLLIGSVWVFISSNEKDPYEEVIYKKGLPKEDSPAFKEFLRNDLGSSTDVTLRYQDDTYTMVRSGIEGLTFYKFTDKQLRNSYKPVFSIRENFEKNFYDLEYGVDFFKQRNIVHDKISENLPDIKIEKKNLLNVKTNFGQKNIKVPLSTDSYEISLDLLAINKENMLIEISGYRPGKASDIYYLFLKQDFSKHQIVKGSELNATIESGKLNDHLSVFPEVTKDGSYLKLLGKNILEKKTNKVREIKDHDFLSADGKYVFLNGTMNKKFPEDVQIQTVDHYLKGDEKYVGEFKINFKHIADQLHYKSSGASFIEILYFKEDYIVLDVLYSGMIIGTAGSANVLIDLQKSKKQPTVYFADLGIEDALFSGTDQLWKR
ncbi:hypothetical protein HOO54_21060 [Bacillus sp. WMMC1349]|uniref:hypothetical protein n=1 Tax=Bacillus sp. WMMC1349 TaxID=2736254 RepID=UPI00155707BF|nr:hypothetical protein [Bacillus sp. WMMC1349]NPC94648.1 hypothetical protein [Bacillus sp. WMMC1349]